MTTVESRGISCFSNSSHLPGTSSTDCNDKPVRLPPGRARLCTSPLRNGSAIPAATIGTVRVAFLAAIAAGVSRTTSTSTCLPITSPISSASRSYCPSANRFTITKLSPSIQPSSRKRCQNSRSAEKVVAEDPECTNPRRRTPLAAIATKARNGPSVTTEPANKQPSVRRRPVRVNIVRQFACARRLHDAQLLYEWTPVPPIIVTAILLKAGNAFPKSILTLWRCVYALLDRRSFRLLLGRGDFRHRLV